MNISDFIVSTIEQLRNSSVSTGTAYTQPFSLTLQLNSAGEVCGAADPSVGTLNVTLPPPLDPNQPPTL